MGTAHGNLQQTDESSVPLQLGRPQLAAALDRDGARRGPMTSHLWRFAAGLPRLTAQSGCYRSLAGVHFLRKGSAREAKSG